MKKIHLFWIIPLLLVFTLFFVRLFGHIELDDVTPGIPCKDSLIQKADVLWVVPNFENNSIEKNQSWCTKLLSLNKTLGMHGIKHLYWEFGENISKEELKLGKEEFYDCFGTLPEMFKPPQLKISSKNKELIKSSNMKLKLGFNQFTHKVYHCNDSDFIKNRWIEIF